MLKINIISIFPEYLKPLELSLLGKAQEKGLISIDIISSLTKLTFGFVKGWLCFIFQFVFSCLFCLVVCLMLAILLCNELRFLLSQIYIIF